MSNSLIILINHMGSGGCQKIVYDIVRNINYDNVYLVSRKGFYLEKINHQNIKFINRNGVLGFLRVLLLIFKARASGRILLHTHNRIDMIYKFLLSKFDMHIHTFHSAYLENNLLMKFIKPKLAISISKVVSDYLNAYNISSQLIYNGIDSDAVITKSIVNKENTKLNLLYVGRISAEKGVFELIESLSKIKTSYNLDIIGDGLLKSKCEGLSDNRVQFLGFKQDPWLNSQKYDLVVIPSFYEGFCLVGLEAVSHNLPVIANDLPIFREILSFLPEELFFDINDYSSLEKSLLFYELNREIIFDLVKNNNKKLMCDFSSKNMIINYRNIYDKYLL